jgi:hypothetical protein
VRELLQEELPDGDYVRRNQLARRHITACRRLCHNPSGSARPDTDMNLRLSVGDRDLVATPAYLSTVGRPLQSFARSELSARVLAGEPNGSAVLQRMLTRESALQMPPLGTERSIRAASPRFARGSPASHSTRAQCGRRALLCAL